MLGQKKEDRFWGQIPRALGYVFFRPLLSIIRNSEQFINKSDFPKIPSKAIFNHELLYYDCCLLLISTVLTICTIASTLLIAYAYFSHSVFMTLIIQVHVQQW